MHNMLVEFGSRVNTDNDPSHFYHLYKYPVTWFMYLLARRSLASIEMTESTRYHRPITTCQLRAKLPTDQYVKSILDWKVLIGIIMIAHELQHKREVACLS